MRHRVLKIFDVCWTMFKSNTTFDFGSVVLNDIRLSDRRFLLAFKNLKNYEDEEQEIKL